MSLQTLNDYPILHQTTNLATVATTSIISSSIIQNMIQAIANSTWERNLSSLGQIWDISVISENIIPSSIMFLIFSLPFLALAIMQDYKGEYVDIDPPGDTIDALKQGLSSGINILAPILITKAAYYLIGSVATPSVATIVITAFGVCASLQYCKKLFDLFQKTFE